MSNIKNHAVALVSYPAQGAYSAYGHVWKLGRKIRRSYKDRLAWAEERAEHRSKNTDVA